MASGRAEVMDAHRAVMRVNVFTCHNGEISIKAYGCEDFQDCKWLFE